MQIIADILDRLFMKLIDEASQGDKTKIDTSF